MAERTGSACLRAGSQVVLESPGVSLSSATRPGKRALGLSPYSSSLPPFKAAGGGGFFQVGIPEHLGRSHSF